MSNETPVSEKGNHTSELDLLEEAYRNGLISDEDFDAEVDALIAAASRTPAASFYMFPSR